MNENNSKRKADSVIIKPLGFILEEAGLISNAQIQVALLDQIENEHLLIGEILALHGWLKQETVEFFAVYWPELLRREQKNKMGEYLKEAGLLTEEQIEIILAEQKKTFMRFGALAVIKGYVKKDTVEFFLKYLYPEKRKESAFIFDSKSENIKNNESEKDSKIILPKYRKILTAETLKEEFQEEDLNLDETKVLNEYLEGNDVIWIA